MPFLAAIPAWVGTAAAIAGTAVTAGSSILGGLQQKAMYNAQAQGAEFNRQVMEGNAQAVERAGAYAEEQKRKQFRRLQGTQEAEAGGSGTTLEGTPLDIMVQTAGDIEDELIAQRYNTAVQAARYRSGANMAAFEAERAEGLADTALPGSFFKAGTQLLTSAGNFLSGGKSKVASKSFGGLSYVPGY